jgi:hypothetical protein
MVLAARECGSRYGRLHAAPGLLFKTIQIACDVLNVPERVPDRLLNDRPKRILYVGEAVVDPKPIPTRVDEAGSAKIGQVSRRFWLRNPKAVVNMTNTDFARRQQAQDAQPSTIPKSLEERFEAKQSLRHICDLTNISRNA